MATHPLTTGMIVLAGGLIAATLGVPAGVTAQDDGRLLPFSPGDTLVYEGRFGRFGSSGTGTLAVAEDRIDGRRVLRFDFDFSGRVMLMSVRDQTSSWMDPVTFTSLRYEKDERHPLGSREESVRIDPSVRRWKDAHGGEGTTPSADPLDELSFLFFLRTIELEPGTRTTMDRHFDQARSPVRIEVLREETVRVPAGEFGVTVVQMTVTDPERFGGEGRVVLYLAHDSNRTPVRIESSVPVAGSLVLSLVEYTQAPVRPSGVRRTSAASIEGESR